MSPVYEIQQAQMCLEVWALTAGLAGWSARNAGPTSQGVPCKASGHRWTAKRAACASGGWTS
jgi:hypothetical protein